MTVSDARLAELIEVYDSQAFRGDLVACLRELQSLRRERLERCGAVGADIAEISAAIDAAIGDKP